MRVVYNRESWHRSLKKIPMTACNGCLSKKNASVLLHTMNRSDFFYQTKVMFFSLESRLNQVKLSDFKFLTAFWLHVTDKE